MKFIRRENSNYHYRKGITWESDSGSLILIILITPIINVYFRIRRKHVNGITFSLRDRFIFDAMKH